MNPFYIILGAIFLFLLVCKIIYDLAPIGYEDETGYHDGTPPEFR